MNERLSITDSPWFWVLIFSLMALGALVSIGPKYNRRQTALERTYQARERVAERLGTNRGDDRGRESDGSAERRELASAENRLVPLWPLAATLTGVAVVAAAMLCRNRKRSGPLEQKTAPP